MFDHMAKNTLVPLILRLGLATIFIFHGQQKVFGEGNELGFGWMKGENARPAIVQMLVAWGELVGGIALAIGFLTRLAAIGIAIIMAGAIYTVHGQHGFSLGKGGYEYNFAILIMCAAVVLLGGGTLAADRIFRVRPRNPMAGNTR
jgi:putative oxidoreductase